MKNFVIYLELRNMYIFLTKVANKNISLTKGMAMMLPFQHATFKSFSPLNRHPGCHNIISTYHRSIHEVALAVIPRAWQEMYSSNKQFTFLFQCKYIQQQNNAICISYKICICFRICSIWSTSMYIVHVTIIMYTATKKQSWWKPISAKSVTNQLLSWKGVVVFLRTDS